MKWYKLSPIYLRLRFDVWRMNRQREKYNKYFDEQVESEYWYDSGGNLHWSEAEDYDDEDLETTM